MKNSIAIFSLTALAAASVQTASAGDREWATVGKILTGVAVVHAIGHAVHHAPVHVVHHAPAVYVPAPVPIVVTVPPRAYYSHHAPVVVCHPPVVVPALVCITPIYRPAPVVRVNLGFGHYSHHGHHGQKGIRRGHSHRNHHR